MHLGHHVEFKILQIVVPQIVEGAYGTLECLIILSNSNALQLL